MSWNANAKPSLHDYVSGKILGSAEYPNRLKMAIKLTDAPSFQRQLDIKKISCKSNIFLGGGGGNPSSNACHSDAAKSRCCKADDAEVSFGKGPTPTSKKYGFRT